MGGAIISGFTGITRHHKKGVNMKKFLFALFSALIIFFIPGKAEAVDWSQYESIRGNIRLEGYQSMPGYIAFGDGDGNILGYVWMSPGKGLVWCSATKGTSYTAGNNTSTSSAGEGTINLRTTKLTDDYGVPVSTEASNMTIADGVMY